VERIPSKVWKHRPNDAQNKNGNNARNDWMPSKSPKPPKTNASSPRLKPILEIGSGETFAINRVPALAGEQLAPLAGKKSPNRLQPDRLLKAQAPQVCAAQGRTKVYRASLAVSIKTLIGKEFQQIKRSEIAITHGLPSTTDHEDGKAK
jgi:hypothetical protein